MSGRGRLLATNHRGRPVPRTLGILLAAGAAASAAVVGRLVDLGPGGVAGSVALLVVFAVGLLDDLVPGGPRGIRGHLRALLEGQITTGLLKAVVITGCAVITATLLPVGVVGGVAGIALLAGAANLGNALDVRPGRALKVFLPILIVGLAFAPLPSHPSLPGLAAAAIPAALRDLRERAMLGDGGANLLGFAGGMVLLLTLPTALLLLVTLGVIALNVLAETLGLSTLIDRSRMLRAIDRAGRIAEP